MTLDKTLLGILLGLFSASGASALDPQLDSGGFREEDRAIAEEIAAFSAEERHAALIAAGHPEDLLEVQQIQSGSADDFGALIEGFPREDQEQIWDLVRYPGLVADLARGGAKSDAELDTIAKRYPEEIRSAIRSAGRERYATWVEVYALDLEAEQALSSVIAKHPAEVRSAFQRLRGQPDLMSLLVDNIGLATRLGAAYREDPTRVEARFDTLHQEVAARKSDEEKNWARELQDPEAQEELRSAARQFAEDQGYDLDDERDGSVIQTRVVHVDHYVNSNPYPYWFGYPSWYDYPYWYPASVWSHVGFRFGGGSSFIQVGLPSPYFLGWYGNYYYGARYGYWNNPGNYYGGGYYGGAYYGGGHHGGGNGYPRHFNSARYYDDHHSRYFNGHRKHSDRYSSQGSGGSGGSSQAFDGNRRGAQERHMNRLPNDRQGRGQGFDRSERSGRRDSGGEVGGDGRSGSNARRFRANSRHPGDAIGGAPGGAPPEASSGGSGPQDRQGVDRSPNDSRPNAPDVGPGGRSSSADPRERLQRRGGARQNRQWTSGEKEGEGKDEAPSLRDAGGRGRRQLPDVSSPPPGRFERADRRGGRSERTSRTALVGSPQRSSHPSSHPSSNQSLTQRDRSQNHGRRESVTRSEGGGRGAQRFDRSAPQSVDRAEHDGQRQSADSVRQSGNNNGGGHRSGGQGGGFGRGGGSGGGGSQAGRGFGGAGR